MRVLLIEDDLELALGLAKALKQSNISADAVHTCEMALAACATTTYQAIVMDLGLPDGDGLDLLRQLRRRNVTAPVLILTARDDLQDRVVGLDAGGDDYLVKPFALIELEARIRALLRRGGGSVSPTLSFGAVELDVASKTLSVSGRYVELTAKEMAVMEFLMQRSGRVVAKHQLLEAIYDWAEDANPSMIEVFISRLRRKLSDADARISIRALRGLGYRLEHAGAEAGA
jgi:DNA-binding response OmpR family regulator